jgi:steroid delta-isomerase-like uncharacterized protein
MSAEENKAIARRSWEAVSQGDVDAQMEVYATDCVIHEPDEDVQGAEGLRQFVGGILAAFPDMSVTVEDEIAEGDKVVTRWTARGTHRGEFLGIAPTGNRVEVTGITIHRIEGGKIAEEWEMPDNLGLMQQIGAIPSPEEAGA